MSTCVRFGIRYKRHTFAGRSSCKACGAKKPEGSRTGRQLFIARQLKHIDAPTSEARKQGRKMWADLQAILQRMKALNSRASL